MDSKDFEARLSVVGAEGAGPSPETTSSPVRTFSIEVLDGYQQGRGAWGGIATGALVSAAERALGDPSQRLRNLTAQILAPVPVGWAHLTVETLRAGSATTSLDVRMLDANGDVLTHAVAVFGSVRGGEEMPGTPEGPDWTRVDAPSALAAGWEKVPVIDLGPPVAPNFLSHFEVRPVSGFPYTREASGETVGWLRPKAPLAGGSDVVIAALADAWWTATIVLQPSPRPMATLGFTLDLPGDPGALPRTSDGRIEPLLHRGRVLAARDGYVVETRELWTAAGQFLAWNTQTVAVIK